MNTYFQLFLVFLLSRAANTLINSEDYHNCDANSEDDRSVSPLFLDNVNARCLLTCSNSPSGPQFSQNGNCVDKCVNQMANLTQRACLGITRFILIYF